MIRTRCLNDFSEDILTHILKFLPTCDAVGTSLLSCEWRRRKLWRTLPFLNFDYNDFRNRHRKGHEGNVPVGLRTRFADFINQTLKNRLGFPIQKFHICFNPPRYKDDDYDPEVKLGDWISYAVSHKATELDILFRNCRSDFNIDLLNNSCVRDITLSSVGCNFRHGLPSLKFDSIRSMSLTEIDLTNDTLKDLISWCNNLESLFVSICSRMHKLEICSSTLKYLTLTGDVHPPRYFGSSLKICCPNLCFLSLSNVEMETYYINVPTSLEAKVYASMWQREAIHELKWWMQVLGQLICVKKLIIQNYFFELWCENDDIRNDDFLDGLLFENLNHLELDTECGVCNLLGMAALLKICPNITTLTLEFGSVWPRVYYLVPWHLVNKRIEFTIPNLRILNLKNTKSVNIDDLLRLMKKHGTALEKIVLWEYNDDKRYLEKYVLWENKDLIFQTNDLSV